MAWLKNPFTCVDPHAYVAYTPNLASPVWLTRPHFGSHTVVSCVRPSLPRSHGRVSHTARHTRDHTLV
ncbi:hypothetical protein J1N35_041579, partial [Gossypium stocksii]